MSKTKMMVESGILIAIAIVLELISKQVPLQLPFGGGITLVSMLPIVIIAYKYGTKWGLLTAFAYSLMQMLLGASTMSAYFIGEDAMSLGNALLITILDYVVAFTVIGLSGVFKGKFKSRTIEMVLGVIVGLGLRYVAHFVSGFIFWGAYADWFFGQDGMGAFGEWVLSTFTGTGLSLFYSAVYNGSYMIPEIVLTSLVAGSLMKMPQVDRYILQQET